MKRIIPIVIASLALLVVTAIVLNAKQAELCANSISCIRDLSGAFEEGAQTAQFEGKTVAAPPYRELAKKDTFVLGETTGKKTIQIDLSSQRLYAMEGDTVIMEFPVSTGKWYPTPTGTFRIWIKLRYTRMRGGSQALGTYYNLPNIPYTMFFANAKVPKTRGFGIHGAYWHNNFGHPMSHGCVNMRIEDAEKLFTWADPPTLGSTTYANAASPGTEVIIYGETPKE